VAQVFFPAQQAGSSATFRRARDSSGVNNSSLFLGIALGRWSAAK